MAPSECSAQTPPEGTLYLNFPEPPFNQADFISDVTCVTGETGGGCGFEQQLEAILASDRNTANGGFSREDALLAVIMITDEDDCSTTDPRVFDVEARPGNPYQGPFADPPTNSQVQFNLRCWAHKRALQQIQRYVDGIANLKSDPSQVVFAAITGIPEDSALDPENFNTDADRYDAILAHPGMEEVPNPSDDGEQDQALTPACIAGDGSGAAAPGVRIVETIQGLAGNNTGVGTVVESICADDYAPALNAIVDRIAAALRQLCLPRPLNRNSQNLVGCEVREVQPADGECNDGRGRELIGTEDVGPAGESDVRNVCRIAQLASDPTAGVPSGLGWFYDDFTPETAGACSFNPEQQRVSFTEGAEPLTGRARSLRMLADRTSSDRGCGLALHQRRAVRSQPGQLPRRGSGHYGGVRGRPNELLRDAYPQGTLRSRQPRARLRHRDEHLPADVREQRAVPRWLCLLR